MNKAFWVIPFLFLPSLIIAANPLFNCPTISIEVEDDELEIEGLTAPIEIVKVFNAAYSLVYECNGNCPDKIELSNLSEGRYNIDIQSYTQNWQFICDQRATILVENQATPDCGKIDIAVNGNTLAMTNLQSPNKIIKVFDVFYNLIDVCFFNCGDTFVVPNLLAGLYRVDIQFYTANWQFICEHKADVLIELTETPCDNSPCQGNVVLTSQKAIDEFCGCPTVEGNLTIGKNGNSDITSLANLRNIEEVKGQLFIQNTKIRDFDGLGNLWKIGGDFRLFKNRFLATFQGLNNLVEIGGAFELNEQHAIKNLKGLDRWTRVEEIVFIQNDNLKDLAKLAQLTHLNRLEINACNKVETLPVLSSIDALSGLTLKNNNSLQDLGFLKGIESISGLVNIVGNNSLSDCCELYRLVDEEIILTIAENGFPCHSIPAVLENCQTNAPSCADIKVLGTEDKITIEGLTAPNVILKVFDAHYRLLYDCFGDCEKMISVADLSVGNYRIVVNFYNENWVPICEKQVLVELNGKDAIVANEDRNRSLESRHIPKFTLAPNPTLGVTYLDLTGTEGLPVNLRLINQFGQKVWSKQIAKVADEPQKIDVSDFQNGLYFLQIQARGRGLVTKKLLVNRLY